MCWASAKVPFYLTGLKKTPPLLALLTLSVCSMLEVKGPKTVVSSVMGLGIVIEF